MAATKTAFMTEEIEFAKVQDVKKSKMISSLNQTLFSYVSTLKVPNRQETAVIRDANGVNVSIDRPDPAIKLIELFEQRRTENDVTSKPIDYFDEAHVFPDILQQMEQPTMIALTIVMDHAIYGCIENNEILNQTITNWLQHQLQFLLTFFYSQNVLRLRKLLSCQIDCLGQQFKQMNIKVAPIIQKPAVIHSQGYLLDLFQDQSPFNQLNEAEDQFVSLLLKDIDDCRSTKQLFVTNQCQDEFITQPEHTQFRNDQIELPRSFFDACCLGPAFHSQFKRQISNARRQFYQRDTNAYFPAPFSSSQQKAVKTNIEQNILQYVKASLSHKQTVILGPAYACNALAASINQFTFQKVMFANVDTQYQSCEADNERNHFHMVQAMDITDLLPNKKCSKCGLVSHMSQVYYFEGILCLEADFSHLNQYAFINTPHRLLIIDLCQDDTMYSYSNQFDQFQKEIRQIAVENQKSIIFNFFKNNSYVCQIQSEKSLLYVCNFLQSQQLKNEISYKHIQCFQKLTAYLFNIRKLCSARYMTFVPAHFEFQTQYLCLVKSLSNPTQFQTSDIQKQDWDNAAFFQQRKLRNFRDFGSRQIAAQQVVVFLFDHIALKKKKVSDLKDLLKDVIFKQLVWLEAATGLDGFI